MNCFVDESLNECVYNLLSHIRTENEFIGQDIKIYNFEEYEIKTCVCPWKEDVDLTLKYDTFVYAPTITTDALKESLRLLVRHNIFLVLGRVELIDNLEIRLSCFTKEAIKNA